MNKVDYEKLLDDPKVLEEINRHKWIESEKLGYDIGFERAAEDWLNRFGIQWAKIVGAPKQNAGIKSSFGGKNGKKSKIF